MGRKSSSSVIYALLIFLIAIGIGGGYFVGRYTSRGESVRQFVLTEDVDRGHSIAGKYKEVDVSSDTSVLPENLVLDKELLDSSIASVPLFANSAITKSTITKEEDFKRNLEFALPMSVEGSIGNSVSVGDVLAVKVSYEEGSAEDDVIISAIPVKDMRTSTGGKIIDESTVPGLLVFDVTNEESSMLNSAKKQGELYVVKYNNLNEEKLPVTYKNRVEPPKKDKK